MGPPDKLVAPRASRAAEAASTAGRARHQTTRQPAGEATVWKTENKENRNNDRKPERACAELAAHPCGGCRGVQSRPEDRHQMGKGRQAALDTNSRRPSTLP